MIMNIPNASDTEPSLPVPPEILRMIVKLLPRSDLLQLRLTTHSLFEAASEVMFNLITVHNDKYSDAQLTNIAKSPFWAGQVRSVLWTFYEREHILSMPSRREYELYKLPKQTEGDEGLLDPSNQYKGLSLMPNIKTLEFSISALSAMLSEDENTGYSFYDIVRLSHLRPSIIKGPYLEIRLMYTPNNRPKELIVIDTGEDGSKFLYEGGYTYLYLFSLDDIIEQEASSLETIILKGFPSPFTRIKQILMFCTNLTNLSIIGGTLTYHPEEPDFTDSVLHLMEFIKNRMEPTTSPRVQLSLEDVAAEYHSLEYQIPNQLELLKWLRQENGEGSEVQEEPGMRLPRLPKIAVSVGSGVF